MSNATSALVETDGDEAMAIAAGFVPIDANTGYMGGLGRFYVDPDRKILAIRINRSHINGYEKAHGGMLATIADTAIGMLLIQEDRNGNPSVTVSLTLDYLSGASLGDWVECHVDYDKIGANLRFATCRVMVGERMVLKANAVFAVSPIPHVISRRTGDSSFREYLTTFGKI